MRNIQEVLREKNSAVERVRREVEALRLVTPLLTEEGDNACNIPLRTMTGNPAIGGVSFPSSLAQDFPAKIPARGTQAITTEAKFGRARKLSSQLKRIAAPLLGSSS